MTVAILAADVRLINFNDSHKFAEIGIGHARPQTMAHIESRPVGTSTEHPVNLQGADAFLGREHQMKHLEPIEQRFLGFLENGPRCQGEAVGRAARLAALFAPSPPVPARVYKGASRFDDEECIILDYSKTSFIASWVRDEIREISRGVYLGKVYLLGARMPDFVLEPALKSRSCSRPDLK